MQKSRVIAQRLDDAISYFMHTFANVNNFMFRDSKRMESGNEEDYQIYIPFNNDQNIAPHLHILEFILDYFPTEYGNETAKMDNIKNNISTRLPLIKKGLPCYRSDLENILILLNKYQEYLLEK